MARDNDGPELRLTASCFDCKHVRAEKYSCQSDWGYDYYCGLVLIEEKPKSIGSHTRTPDWCPLFKKELDKFIKTIGLGS